MEARQNINDFVNKIQDMITKMSIDPMPEEIELLRATVQYEKLDAENIISLLYQIYDSPKKLFLIDVLQSQIFDKINTSQDFINLLSVCTEQERSRIFEKLEAKIPTFTNTSIDVVNVLQLLNSEQHTKIFESIKDKLPCMVKDGDSLYDVLLHLTVDECKFILDIIKPELNNIIKYHTDFMALQNLDYNNRVCTNNYLYNNLNYSNMVKWELGLFGGMYNKRINTRTTPEWITTAVLMDLDSNDHLKDYRSKK